MSTIGGNSIICGGIYNTPDEELQKKVEMTDSVRSLVEDALAEEPVSEEHAQLIEAVKADYEAYQAAGSQGLFDSVNCTPCKPGRRRQGRPSAPGAEPGGERLRRPAVAPKSMGLEFLRYHRPRARARCISAPTPLWIPWAPATSRPLAPR